MEVQLPATYCAIQITSENYLYDKIIPPVQLQAVQAELFCAQPLLFSEQAARNYPYIYFIPAMYSGTNPVSPERSPHVPELSGSLLLLQNSKSSNASHYLPR